MSKKLLDNVYAIENAIRYLKGNNYINEDSYSMEALHYIEKALTPPTAEEVCKALKKVTGCEIEYKDNSFIATVPLPNRHRQVIVKKQRNTNNIKFYDKNIPRHLTQIDYLPPHHTNRSLL